MVGVSLIPGPSSFIAFSHGASHGWSRTLYTAFGNSFATFLQATAATAGLGVIITSSATLFIAIKYAGAAYLIYVGIQMWRSTAQTIEYGKHEQNMRPAKLTLSGFSIAIGNPKAIAFFTAFFPQFLSTDGNSFTQLAVMVTISTLSAFIAAFLYGCLGAWLRRLELSKSIMARIYKTTGGLFVASGIGLMASKNG